MKEKPPIIFLPFLKLIFLIMRNDDVNGDVQGQMTNLSL